MDWIINDLVSYGIFAILFGWLLYTTNKHNEKREERYHEMFKENQAIISKQGELLDRLSNDVKEIKYVLQRSSDKKGGNS